MKRIKKLKTKNLKGSSQQVEFKPKTVIVGDNASGKSSILDGIKLALLGEHDHLGKQGKKLMALSSGTGDMEATLDFTDGETCAFHLKPSGATAKANHIGIPVDPSLRLNLCPDEFWGKGETARMETLLQMCGDGSLVTENFVASCIKRVRVSGMTTDGEGSDLADLNSIAEEARQIIIDGDISTLAQLEKRISEERTERSREVKRMKAVVEEMGDSQEDPIDTDAEDDIKDELADLLKRSEKMGKEMAKEERGKARQEELLKMEASESNQADYSERKAHISTIKGSIEELNIKLAGYVDENPQGQLEPQTSEHTPLSGDICKVECSAVWTGKSFAMIQDTVRWAYLSEGGLEREKEIEELKFKISEKNEELDEAISNMVDGWESQHEMSIKDREELSAVRGIDYEERIQGINTILSQVKEQADSLQSVMNYSALCKAQDEQRLETLNRHDVAERRQKLILAVLKVIRDMQSDIINTAVKGALLTVNKVTQGIVATPVEWDGKTLGRTTESGEWVSIDTFSGAEKAVTQMALGVALASRSDFKLAILDEVSRLDNENVEKLLSNLNALVDSKELDQYIAFCIDEPKSCQVLKNAIHVSKTLEREAELV